MFCLRSWLPLLFIPTNASPFFILSFVVLTYILHRPCIYCSALLLILFTSSCQWSDHCFFDVRGDWFAPRFSTTATAAAGFGSVGGGGGVSTTNDGAGMTSILDKQSAGGSEGDATFASFIQESINSTVAAVAAAALEDIKRKTVAAAATVAGRSSLSATGVGVAQEWTGIGLEWLRSLLGRREWTIPCLDVKVQL